MMQKKRARASRTRSTNKQIDQLIDYMSTHEDLANNEQTSSASLQKVDQIQRNKLQEEWKELANMLREHGPDRSVERWKHTWRDLKKKARNELKRVQTENTEPLPIISRRDIKILNALGFDNITVVDDETENGESRDSNDDATIEANTDEDCSNDNNSVKDQSEHEFEHTFHIRPTRNSTPNNSVKDQSEHEFGHKFHNRPTRNTTPNNSVKDPSEHKFHIRKTRSTTPNNSVKDPSEHTFHTPNTRSTTTPNNSVKDPSEHTFHIRKTRSTTANNSVKDPSEHKFHIRKTRSTTPNNSVKDPSEHTFHTRKTRSTTTPNNSVKDPSEHTFYTRKTRSTTHNNSVKDQSEHEFEHKFHIRPTRSTTPLITHNTINQSRYTSSIEFKKTTHSTIKQSRYTSNMELNKTTKDQRDSDEYGIFGLLIAKKIRKLNYRHRLLAQQGINDILFDLGMRELKT